MVLVLRQGKIADEVIVSSQAQVWLTEGGSIETVHLSGNFPDDQVFIS